MRGATLLMRAAPSRPTIAESELALELKFARLERLLERRRQERRLEELRTFLPETESTITRSDRQ